MHASDRKNFLFWVFMVFLYALSIALSYNRIYIKADYPIFYEEELLPAPLDDLKQFLKLDQI